ncbi:hypothetical protein [Ideonella livida]|uniref:Phosphate ABC transporter substrate-binding protein n=1 Tax=Ideonella livida TaxID=2707176 RepID=A0A7C9TL02_9BURK|nr:hypothetical protein [Ideonella livida]NDY93120.1 hypothetical protein [Ideonella livida]
MHHPLLCHAFTLAMATSLAGLGVPIVARAQGGPEPELLVVVGQGSAVTTAEVRQLFDLYTGRRTALPGHPATQPIEQHRGAEARALFYAGLGQATPAQVDSHWARLQFSGRLRPPLQARDDADMARRLRADPNAIGYLLAPTKEPGLRVVLRLPPRPASSP